MRKIIVYVMLFFFIQLSFQVAIAANTCCVNVDLGFCEERDDGTCPDYAEEDTYTGVASCSAVTACEAGCCCATEYASNPDAWNLDEEGLLKIRASCDALNQGATAGNPYEFKAKGTSSCLDICGSGSSTTPTGGQYTITGVVSNASGPLPDATVLIALTTLQATTNAEGIYTISGVPPLDGQLVATHYGCDPVTEPIIVDGNEEQDFTLDCSTTMCRPDGNPSMTAEVIRGTTNAKLTFNTGLSCGEPTSYHVVRTDGEVYTIPYEPNATYIDEGLEPNTNYCYKVAAQYDTQLVPASLNERFEVCLTTGDLACMTSMAESLEWCVNTPESSLMTCRPDNTIEETSCADGQVCSFVGNGRYSCINEPSCAECNGLFGMLSNRVFTVYFLGTEHSCDSPDVQNLCFKDQSVTIIDAYRSCGEITNCEGYRSETQCGANPCVVQASCSWKPIFPEVGKGICQSTDQPAACGSCEDIFGGCNTALCESIGQRGATTECYYDAATNGMDYSELPSRCRHKEEMACRYYDTQQDCLGSSGNAKVAAVYSGETRTGTTHEVLTPSDDRLSIGLCKWQPVPGSDAGGFCYKDADEYVRLGAEDDCIDNGIFAERGDPQCLQDATPPKTTVVLTESTTLGIHEIANMEYLVSDNYYEPEDLATHFCIYKTGTPPCYPDKTLREAVAALPDMDLLESDSFTVKYYSFDLSGNLEPVQEKVVTLIELGFPIIESAEIRE